MWWQRFWLERWTHQAREADLDLLSFPELVVYKRQRGGEWVWTCRNVCCESGWHGGQGKRGRPAFKFKFLPQMGWQVSFHPMRDLTPRPSLRKCEQSYTSVGPVCTASLTISPEQHRGWSLFPSIKKPKQKFFPLAHPPLSVQLWSLTKFHNSPLPCSASRPSWRCSLWVTVTGC